MARKPLLNEKTYPASFRGVDFLVTAESVERGQKLAIHEYPNSNVRFAEPLGSIPSVYNLTCIIHGEFAIQQRLLLFKKLETFGTGILVHPIDGYVEVQPGKVTASSRQSKLGEFIFNVEFFTSESVSPEPLPADGNSVSDQAELARDAVDNKFEDSYKDADDAIGQKSAVDSALGVLDSIDDAIKTVTDPIQSAIASTNAAIGRFRNGVYKIMRTATSAKDSFKDVYANVIQLKANASELTNAWQDLISFGDDEEEIDQSTASRTTRANNSATMSAHTQITGLIGFMEAISNTDFQNDEDLQNQTKIMDDAFNDFFNVNANSFSEDLDVREQVSKLRSYAKTALDSQKSNVWKIIDIEPGPSSISLSSYQYYGNLDDIETIVDLNTGVSVANFKSGIKAISK